jgi:dTDP-4-dehydrorhamnose 3,5-epimerase
MHFQRPPMDHIKLIYLTSGRITDVILDLRKSSKTYNQYRAVELSANKDAILIPKGVAHGFIAREDNTIVVYNQSSIYNENFDDGILWNSFGFEWNIDYPILSRRDKSFVSLNYFDSPFL